MRAIDGEELRKWIEGECRSPSIPQNEAAFGRRIINHMQVMPKIDAQERVRGYWEFGWDRMDGRTTWYKCSVCGETMDGWHKATYCPRCGAYMKWL